MLQKNIMNLLLLLNLYLFDSTIPQSKLIDLRKYYSTEDKNDHLEFVIVMDAGSSGTRLNVYGFNNKRMIEIFYNCSIEPGVSALLENEIFEQLSLLVNKSEKDLQNFIPDLKKVPLAYLATAGLRLIPKDQSKNILKSIKLFFNKYLLKDLRMITGAEEGLLGLRSLLIQKKMEHYILRKFGCELLSKDMFSDELKEEYCYEVTKHLNHPHTYGIIDLGGGSVEVAYTDLTTNELISQSFLGFGLNESLKTIKTHPSFQKCKIEKENLIKEDNTLTEACQDIFNTLFSAGPKEKYTSNLKKMNEIFLVSFIHEKLFTNQSHRKTLNDLKDIFHNKCSDLKSDECVKMYFLILLLDYFDFKKDTNFFLMSDIFDVTINWSVAEGYDLLFKK